jgi:hypothetical protein
MSLMSTLYEIDKKLLFLTKELKQDSFEEFTSIKIPTEYFNKLNDMLPADAKKNLIQIMLAIVRCIENRNTVNLDSFNYKNEPLAKIISVSRLMYQSTFDAEPTNFSFLRILALILYGGKDDPNIQKLIADETTKITQTNKIDIVNIIKN